MNPSNHAFRTPGRYCQTCGWILSTTRRSTHSNNSHEMPLTYPLSNDCWIGHFLIDSLQRAADGQLVVNKEDVRRFSALAHNAEQVMYPVRILITGRGIRTSDGTFSECTLSILWPCVAWPLSTEIRLRIYPNFVLCTEEMR